MIVKKIKNLFLAAILAVGITSVGAGTAEAGSTCYAPLVQRSADGNYVTYTSYGTGTGISAYHRVRVYKDGQYHNGPWKAGVGYSILTLYAPGFYGIPSCQVYGQ